ncbi:hypothetical protein, partial [Streptomyces phyllanthi]
SLLVGCTGGSAEGGGGEPSRPTGSPSGGTSPSASASGGSPAVSTPDPELVPRTSAAAERLVRSVALGPDDWGRGFVAQSPGESTPGTWAVLDGTCRWQRERLPKGVLASLSRYSSLPGGDGKGTVKVTVAVTAHDSVLGADEQLSTTLEEVLRCPEQRLRSDERLTGLMSLGTPFGAREQRYADDSVLETGEYAEEGGGTGSYRWMVARLGTVVVAVAVKGAEGYTQPELNELGTSALVQMLERVQQQVEKK